MSRTRVIQAGHCMSTVAAETGVGQCQVLLDAPENAELRRARRNPNALQVGDVVNIPEHKPLSLKLENGKLTRVVLKRPTAMVRTYVYDLAGEPIADAPYVLDAGEQRYEGNTTGDGLVEHTVGLEVTSATLRVRTSIDDEPIELVWQLMIGQLASADAIDGAQARLNNLGFACGKVDGECGDRTRSALLAFQRDQELEETGELDAATIAALHREHDGIA